MKEAKVIESFVKCEGEEAKALENFIRGENDALTFFYRKWKAELFLVAYHYLRSTPDTEDVLADCFEKLIGMDLEYRWHKFHFQKVDLKAMLLVMIRNKCLDQIKTKNTRRRIQENIFQSQHQEEKHNSTDFFTDNFHKLCQCLSPKESRILKMHLDGFTHKEIASNAELSIKTVKNNITLAKKKVKLLWKQYMQ